MKIDIRRYLTLRDSLIKEKTQLEERLQEINQALGEGGTSEATVTNTAKPPAMAPMRGRGKRGRSGISLREAVLQATAGGPLTKEEILERVKSLGYRFSTNNPLNSLGVILYGKNPKFKNQDGRFSPLGGVGSSSRPANAPTPSSSAGTTVGGRGRKRRTMSPEAKARIAAAQRARWAKTKSGK